MKQQIQKEARMDRLQEDSKRFREVLENQKNEKTCYPKGLSTFIFARLFVTFDIMFGIVE